MLSMMEHFLKGLFRYFRLQFSQQTKRAAFHILSSFSSCHHWQFWKGEVQDCMDTWAGNQFFCSCGRLSWGQESFFFRLIDDCVGKKRDNGTGGAGRFSLCILRKSDSINVWIGLSTWLSDSIHFILPILIMNWHPCGRSMSGTERRMAFLLILLVQTQLQRFLILSIMAFSWEICLGWDSEISFMAPSVLLNRRISKVKAGRLLFNIMAFDLMIPFYYSCCFT